MPAHGESEEGTERLSPIARWTVVMEAFAEADSWGIRDLAKRTGLSRSAVHRIVHELEQVGYVVSVDGTGRFRIGAAVLRLASRLLDRVDIVSIARPILEQACVESEETVILGLYDPSRQAFFAATAVEPAHPVRHAWEQLREWSDLYTGSSGKSILAFLPPEEQEAVIAPLPEPVPGLRPISKAELRRQLDTIRTVGYATSHGERFEGTVGAGAPILDGAGHVRGNVIITWPEQRTPLRIDLEMAVVAVRAARKISAALGYLPA